ncbi:hypothetical protein JOC54_003992 [Alkalihalobacillus xiaoxiensis]|uniref:Uncharacterized protein n=1 Tax=Shouchella xiaoxiensis TaxID=766895 RepID=A0ABS2T1X2_9BACI|nr:hypothetical protein [Shouchella xiaoxiensis]
MDRIFVSKYEIGVCIGIVLIQYEVGLAFYREVKEFEY